MALFVVWARHRVTSTATPERVQALRVHGGHPRHWFPESCLLLNASTHGTLKSTHTLASGAALPRLASPVNAFTVIFDACAVFFSCGADTAQCLLNHLFGSAGTNGELALSSTLRMPTIAMVTAPELPSACAHHSGHALSCLRISFLSTPLAGRGSGGRHDTRCGGLLECPHHALQPRPRAADRHSVHSTGSTWCCGQRSQLDKHKLVAVVTCPRVNV